MVTIHSIVKHVGIAGQLAYTAHIQHDTDDAPSWVRFIGSTYGGPVVMESPKMCGVFVTDPSRFGEFGVQWVRRFFA